MISAAAAQSSAAMNLVSFLFLVAAGLTVAALGYIGRGFRGFMKQHGADHKFLMETTKANTEAIGKNTEAIKQMLEERRPLRRR